MTLPEIVNDVVKYDPSYSANPKNDYHWRYQRAINRQFTVSFLVAFVAMLYFNLGLLGILDIAIWVFVGIAAVCAVIGLLYLVFFVALPSFITWLKGD